MRRTGRVVAAGAAALLVGSLAACSTDGYWAVRNATDLAIMEELRQDPWLAPRETQSTYVPLGVPVEDDHWVHGWARGYGDRVEAPLPEVAQAQVAAAEAAGWWPYFATCSADTQEFGQSGEDDLVEVLLTRELSGGVHARAELAVSEYVHGQGRDLPTEVYAEVTVPSHRNTQATPPEAIDLTDLRCISEGGAESVGDDVDLLEDHR